MILPPLVIKFASLRHIQKASYKPLLCRTVNRVLSATKALYVCTKHAFHSEKKEIIARDLREGDMSSPSPSAVSRLLSNSPGLQFSGIPQFGRLSILVLTPVLF